MPDRPDWPQQIRKPTVLANFRPSLAERAKPKPSWRAQRTGMSPEHLDLIRKLPCCLCSNRPSQSHHLKSGPAAKERALYVKATDRHAIPLCGWVHHPEVERIGSRNEIAYFERSGIDPHELANALWKATGDLARMGAVLVAHKQSAIRTLTKRAAVNCLMAHGLTRAEAEEQYDAGKRRV